jgi:hypothetical protein
MKWTLIALLGGAPMPTGFTYGTSLDGSRRAISHRDEGVISRG